jgi:hypothetical protein
MRQLGTTAARQVAAAASSYGHHPGTDRDRREGACRDQDPSPFGRRRKATKIQSNRWFYRVTLDFAPVGSWL